MGNVYKIYKIYQNLNEGKFSLRKVEEIAWRRENNNEDTQKVKKLIYVYMPISVIPFIWSYGSKIIECFEWGLYHIIWKNILAYNVMQDKMLSRKTYLVLWV